MEGPASLSDVGQTVKVCDYAGGSLRAGVFAELTVDTLLQVEYRAPDQITLWIGSDFRYSVSGKPVAFERLFAALGAALQELHLEWTS